MMDMLDHSDNSHPISLSAPFSVLVGTCLWACLYHGPHKVPALCIWAWQASSPGSRPKNHTGYLEECGAGFLPHLSEQRTSSRTLLGSRLTSVSHCFSISFTIHDLCCIFSFYLFGPKTWVGRKRSLESNRRMRRNWHHI